MTKLTGILFFLGILLVGAAGMMAVDTFMNEDRKTAVRNEISDQIDAGADRYAERREEGCRRRCGFFGSMSAMVNGLRNGVFSSLPFDPETAFPDAPEGWTISAYDLAAVERIVGAKMVKTPLISGTQNTLLQRMDATANAAETGAVRVFSKADAAIALSIHISRDGLRGDVKPGQRVKLRGAVPSVTVNGLPFHVHPARAYDAYGENPTRVGYRHYVMDIDGQVTITALSTASDAETQALLQGFDLTQIVDTLPRKPAGYRPGPTDLSLAEASAAKP